MAEASDQLRLVHVVRRCFHATNDLHLLVVIETLFAIAGNASARTGVEHMQLVGIRIVVFKLGTRTGLSNRCDYLRRTNRAHS